MQPASRGERARGHRAIVPSEFVPEGSGRADAKSPVVSSAFLIARNPEADSTLPFLIFIPIDGGLWLKARESWPRASRVKSGSLSAGRAPSTGGWTGAGTGAATMARGGLVGQDQKLQRNRHRDVTASACSRSERTSPNQGPVAGKEQVSEVK